MGAEDLKALIAGLTARLDGINEKIDTQRQEGKERGDKIVGLLEHTANLETRVAEMERHVHNECVWGNGEINSINRQVGELNAKFNEVHGSVNGFESKLETLRKYIIVWILAGSALGGGAASGASEFLLKILGA